MSDIDEWLVYNEKITYDTNNYDLVVAGEKNFRGVVTNKRAIFVTENRMHEVKNSLVASLTFTRKIYLGLLVAGIIALLVVGGYLVYGYDPITAQQVGILSVNYFAYTVLAVGIILILIFLFYRPENLDIYAGNRMLVIRGPRNMLKNIAKEIRKND